MIVCWPHWPVIMNPAGVGQIPVWTSVKTAPEPKVSCPTLLFRHCSMQQQRKWTQESFYETFQLFWPVAQWLHQDKCQTTIFLWMFPWRNKVRRCWGYLSCPGFTVENAIWILSEVQEDGQNQHSHISSAWNHNWLFLLWVSSILYHFCVPLIVILFSKSFNKHLIGIVIWIGRSFSVMMQLQVQAVVVLLLSAIWWFYIYSSSMFCCVYLQ